jgi:hypothetical protein
MLFLVLITIVSLVCIYYIFFKYVERFSQKEKIFVFWNQGWKDAPYICKMCLNSWRKYNGDAYEIVAIDNETISHYINDPVIVKTINDIGTFKSWTQASDLLRINLLAMHGGFWVDSTMLCTKPINEYKHLIRTKYNFWCPFDIDSKLHSYNYFYSTQNNTIIKKVAHALNRHFYTKPVDSYNMIDHLYIGRYMYDRMDELIDWNVIKERQLTASSNTKKLGYKMFANSKDLLLQRITRDMISKIEQQYFLKLTTRHGINNYAYFSKGTVIDYLIRKYT